MNPTTDTPRTDAELEKHRNVVYSSFFSMASRAKQLERELAEAHRQLEASKIESETRRKAIVNMIAQNNSLEAEIERLKANLRRAIEIAVEFYENIPSAETMFLRESVEELEAIKATLNTDNK